MSNDDLEAARAKHASMAGQISFVSRKRARQSPEQPPEDTRHTSSSRSGPYGRCPSVSERYEKIGRIGEGTYGVVYKARDRRTGAVVALKRCLPHHEASDGFPITTLREITVLRELAGHEHPGIVRLLEVAVSSSRSGVFLVFELSQHDLANLVDTHYAARGRSPFRVAQVKQLARQLLSAVAFLHSRHLIHRDIKLSNLLYDHRGRIRLADFGLCRRVGPTRQVGGANTGGDRASPSRPSQLPEPRGRDPNNLTPKVVSLWYRPIELLLGMDIYDEGVDNWAVGCVLGELLEGRPLLKGRNELDQIGKLFDLLGPPGAAAWTELSEAPLVRSGTVRLPRRPHVPPFSSGGTSLLDRFGNLSVAGIRLLSQLLRYDRGQRITAEGALKSEYFLERPLPSPIELMPKFPESHKN